MVEDARPSMGVRIVGVRIGGVRVGAEALVLKKLEFNDGAINKEKLK